MFFKRSICGQTSCWFANLIIRRSVYSFLAYISIFWPLHLQFFKSIWFWLSDFTFFTYTMNILKLRHCCCPFMTRDLQTFTRFSYIVWIWCGSGSSCNVIILLTFWVQHFSDAVCDLECFYKRTIFILSSVWKLYERPRWRQQKSRSLFQYWCYISFQISIRFNWFFSVLNTNGVLIEGPSATVHQTIF